MNKRNKRESINQQENKAKLKSFSLQKAKEVLAWVGSAEELLFWTAREDYPLTSPEVFQEWHQDPEIFSYLLVVKEKVFGYGEIWFDASDNTAELARLLIAPKARRQGMGQKLIQLLKERVQSLGFSQVFIRIHPNNQIALQCYKKALFVPLSSLEQEEFNRGESQSYYWMAYQFKAP